MGKLLQNFTTWKGDYREIKFSIDDVVTAEGCTAEWAMASTEGGAAIITKTTEDSPATITISGKYVTVKLSPADTSSLTAGSYYHELRLVDTSTNPAVVATGTITLKAATTIL